jgi:hypothetical protein
VTDFMNFKIEQVQTFGGAYRGWVCIRVFIGVSDHTYMSIYVCTLFLEQEKKSSLIPSNSNLS